MLIGDKQQFTTEPNIFKHGHETIDTVTDADANGRYVVWNKTGINDNDAVAGKGTYNGTAWSAEFSSYAIHQPKPIRS